MGSKVERQLILIALRVGHSVNRIGYGQALCNSVKVQAKCISV